MTANLREGYALIGYLVTAIIVCTVLVQSYGDIGLSAPDLQALSAGSSNPDPWWRPFIYPIETIIGVNVLQPLADITNTIALLMVWNVANENVIPWWVNILLIKLPELGLMIWVALAVRG